MASAAGTCPSCGATTEGSWTGEGAWDRSACCLIGGVVNYIHGNHPFEDPAMNTLDELTVSQAASYLSVREETVRRNVRLKHPSAFRRGTQWFTPRDALVVFLGIYEPRLANATVALRTRANTPQNRVTLNMLGG